MSTVKRKIILKKLSALNTVWHPESGLVFKSQKERTVIGSYIDNKLVDLDEDSLALCEEWNFKPDESLLANEEEEEEGEEEGEGEEEEGVSEGVSEGDGEEASEEGGEEASESNGEEASEEEGEEKQFDKPAPTPKLPEKTNCTNESTDIQPHLATFHKDVENISKNLSSVLTPIFADLQSKIKELEKELEQKTRDNKELQSKYDAMDQKFKAMKSLFT